MLKFKVVILLVICINGIHSKGCYGCPRNFKKMGCFALREEATPFFLITDLVVTRLESSGLIFNQSSPEVSLRSLLCRCAGKVGKGKVFALANNGECYGGKDDKELLQMVRNKSFAPPVTCKNAHGQICNDNQPDEDCIGIKRHGYYYLIMNSIDGGWSGWSTFTKCNVTCGEGFRIRTRTCTQPTPQYGGKQCVGLTQETKECDLPKCPRNGGFSSWSSFSACSKSCGGGLKMRQRACTSPTPLNGGKNCTGLFIDSQACNTNVCPVPWSCQLKYTQWDEDGNGDARYLDRHYLSCPDGFALNYMRLLRNNDGTRYRFMYKCCLIGGKCLSSRRVQNPFTYDGSGSARNLDRQHVECNDDFLTSLKLEPNALGLKGDKVRYTYTCCKIMKKPACYTRSTAYTEDGGGNAIYLDRQTITCDRQHSLASFHLIRDTNTMKYWRYNYRCCKTNQA